MFFRIYARPSDEYFSDAVNIKSKDIDCIIEQIAKTVKTDEKGNRLLVDDNAAPGRVKKLISQESNKCINKIPYANDNDNLGVFVSLKQVKRLLNALENNDGIISGYSFVIIHIMYKMLYPEIKNNHKLHTILTNCSKALIDIINDYFEDYPGDFVAEYIVQCEQSVYDEIVQLSDPIDFKGFPPIPRKKPE